MTQEPKIFPYIVRLLQGAEVVWKPLGEVAEYEQPTKYLVKSSNYKDIYLTPVLTAGKTFILGYTDETEGIYKASISPVIIFDDFTTANKWVDFDFKAKSSAMKMITSKNEKEVLLKYIYYWLNTLPSELIEGDHKRQWISNYANKKIPLPPLSVQQEIVRILDKFTQLEAELEAELDCRKRQYEYYRNKLLTFNEIGGGTEIVWKTLGEVSKKISSGGTPKTTVSEYYNGEIPWLRTQEVGYGEIWDTSIKITEEAIKNSSAKWIPKDCVIIAMYGATVGRVGINKIPLTTNQACANIEVNEEIANYKYIYYYLLNQYEYIKSLGAGSQTNINAQIVKSLKIPLPPLEEQQRISNILDKFDTLVNSISEGLPKEIALRRKQYEYYRERLLTFTNNQ
jgi:COG0732: restriction endonuclease S subunits